LANLWRRYGLRARVSKLPHQAARAYLTICEIRMNLAALQSQVAHRPLVIEYEADNRIADPVRVDRASTTPTVIRATEPSTPTFYPSLRRKSARACSVMNRMMSALACGPS
jgi:hypothetical protein